MKIVVVGLRGFPNIQGGVETHCEELFPRIARYGHEIIVTRRSGFVKENPRLTTYKGVKFKDLSAPSISGFEAAVHTLKGIWYAKRVHADLVHIQAIGPSIALPLAKILGLRVVMTHHGPDYDREKWGWFPKLILRLGERFAAYWADDIISISTVITDILQKKYNRTNHVHLIYNGITTFPTEENTSILQELQIEEGKYILAVGRFVEEKRFDHLIEAYIKLKRPDYKLVIAGDADYESTYCYSLKEFARENNVIMPGIVKGGKLKALFQHAALFVLPSSHEGLPITLLEAMSFSCRVLASDIPANLAVHLPAENYFPLNDTSAFVEHLEQSLARGPKQTYDLSPYNWDNIARQTNEVYTSMH